MCWNQIGPVAAVPTASNVWPDPGGEGHQRAFRSCRSRHRNLALGMASGLTARGSAHDREIDSLPKYSGGEVTLGGVHEHRRIQGDLVEFRAITVARPVFSNTTRHKVTLVGGHLRLRHGLKFGDGRWTDCILHRTLRRKNSDNCKLRSIITGASCALMEKRHILRRRTRR